MEVLLIALLVLVALALMYLVLSFRTVSERLSLLEKGQGEAGTSLQSMQTRLAETDVVAHNLLDSSSAIRSSLSQTQQQLAMLQARARARQDMEQQSAESLRRLEAVIAGTQSRGAAGENIIDVVFAQLPVAWQARNHRVGNKTVEYGLRLPNGQIVPIDSKWSGANLIEQLLATENMAEKQRLKQQIHKTVLSRAREVRKYVDPTITAHFGIAAVPDAVFDLCSEIQVEIWRTNVVLISYSMFIPYVLLVFETATRASQDVDIDRLLMFLESSQAQIEALQGEVEGRLSRSINMLNDPRDDMRTNLGTLSSGLSSLRITPPQPSAGGNGANPRRQRPKA